jgi:hypothetical protein
MCEKETSNKSLLAGGAAAASKCYKPDYQDSDRAPRTNRILKIDWPGIEENGEGHLLHQERNNKCGAPGRTPFVASGYMYGINQRYDTRNFRNRIFKATQPCAKVFRHFEKSD